VRQIFVHFTSYNINYSDKYKYCSTFLSNCDDILCPFKDC